jgi:hypothetical protein
LNWKAILIFFQTAPRALNPLLPVLRLMKRTITLLHKVLIISFEFFDPALFKFLRKSMRMHVFLLASI